MLAANRRTELLTEADALLRKSSFTKEDASRVDALIALADRTSPNAGEIRKARQAAINREINGATEQRVVSSADRRFMRYLKGEKLGDLLPEMTAAERRAAQSATTGTAGGYLVTPGFMEKLWTAIRTHDAIFELSTVFETPTGASAGHPILDDGANAASVVSENAASSEVDAVFASITFDCVTWRTGLVRAPMELLDDSAFDFETLIAEAFAKRIAKGVGASHTATLLTEASSGVTAAGTTSVIADELWTLAGSVDEEFLPRSSWLMRYSTYVALRKLKDSSGLYQLPAETMDGRPALLGRPVYFSPAMGALSAGAKPIAFGDFSKFVRRIAGPMVVNTHAERYAEFAQFGYEGILRTVGHLLKTSAVVPVKYLTMAA